MKKLLLILVWLVVILAACGKDESKNKENVPEEKAAEESENQKVEVDKGIFNVELTLPAAYFEGEDIDTVIADAKKDGVGEVIKNDDGSLTYKMTKSKHNEMLKEMEVSLLEYIEELKNNEDFQSIKDVTYNKSFSEFTLVVDKETYENSFDGFAALGLGMTGMFYQLFNGVDSDDYKINIDLKDETTGEVFDNVVYPDALEE